MNRIDRLFVSLKKRRRKALIGYITAGYPRKTSTRVLAPRLVDAGIDLLELGVPFSDPLADGPTIQRSSQKALENGVTLIWVLNTVAQLRRTTQVPIVLMTYSNPVLAMGLDRFFARAKEVGVDGIIVPDLIPEEGRPFERPARQNGIHLIYLVAPTTPTSRIPGIARASSGFVYAVSLTGVTGARAKVAVNVAGFLHTVKRLSRKPVAVGFGLSTPQQVRAIRPHTDSVIVGSALIHEISKDTNNSFGHAVRFIRALQRALNGRKDGTRAS